MIMPPSIDFGSNLLNQEPIFGVVIKLFEYRAFGVSID
jgi:hypothetical protein